jgi:hypothetical protein
MGQNISATHLASNPKESSHKSKVPPKARHVKREDDHSNDLGASRSSTNSPTPKRPNCPHNQAALENISNGKAEGAKAFFSPPLASQKIVTEVVSLVNTWLISVYFMF